MSWLFTQPPPPPPPPRMEGASSSALAAGGEYARVRLRLTGKLTPLRRRSSAPSDGGSASSSSTDIEEEEAELRGLLDAAVARAEQENSWLRSHDAWARVVDRHARAPGSSAAHGSASSGVLRWASAHTQTHGHVERSRSRSPPVPLRCDVHADMCCRQKINRGPCWWRAAKAG